MPKRKGIRWSEFGLVPVGLPGGDLEGQVVRLIIHDHKHRPLVTAEIDPSDFAKCLIGSRFAEARLEFLRPLNKDKET